MDQGGCVSDRPSAPLDFKTTRMTNMKTPFSGNYNLIVRIPFFITPHIFRKLFVYVIININIFVT